MKLYFATIGWKVGGEVRLLEMSPGDSALDAAEAYQDFVDSPEAEEWLDIHLVCVRSLDELHERLYGEPPNSVVQASRKSLPIYPNP